MYYFGANSQFFSNLTIFLVIILSLFFSFSWIMRKLLNVKRKKIFSIDYINDAHKRYDRTIRIGSVFFFIILSVFLFDYSRFHYSEASQLLFFVSMLFTAAGELLRAYMEWKYRKDQNDYILTLCNIIFMTAMVIVIIKSDFLGLFV
ncbi:DUF4181 domain-containing protein [Oceanobacillus massiliensis]|uniref:DUF4181 domain-containing protein n=1 Tax=Oceanobacillus massiliensis TaxID=1465765 RepID=UPI00028A301E|nr:DUF4181 domain-containing protein [Oceanobacillus massiliensis]